MQEFNFEIVIKGKVSGPDKIQVAQMLAANITIPLTLIQSVEAVHVNAEPQSKIQIVNPSQFNKHGMKLEK